MPLADAPFMADILSASKATDWNSYGNQLGTAISTYLESGDATTIQGPGTLITTGVAAFQSALDEASSATMWDDYAEQFSSATVDLISSSQVIIPGWGVGSIAVTGGEEYTSGLKDMYASGATWTIQVTVLKNLVKTLITSSVTSPSGSIS